MRSSGRRRPLPFLATPLSSYTRISSNHAMILATPLCVYTSVIAFGRQSGFATLLAASLTSGMGSAAGDTFVTGNGANRTKSSVSDVTRAIEYDGSFTNSSSESADAAVASSPS